MSRRDNLHSPLVIRKLLDSGQFQECAEAVREKKASASQLGGEEWYCLAIAGHFSGAPHEEIMDAFAKAASAGFNEYWLYHWRAAHLLSIGRVEEALIDATKAMSISPTEGAIRLFDGAMDSARAEFPAKLGHVGVILSGLYLRLREQERRISMLDSSRGA